MVKGKKYGNTYELINILQKQKKVSIVKKI